MDRNIVIIGGGAAGLMAAISAAINKNNADNINITILEHNDRVGKKILQTGNGKCNYTNTYLEPDCYYAKPDSFAIKAINLFDEKKTLSFFEHELGILPYIRDGYVYPRSEQASAILDALRIKCELLKIKIVTECNVKEIKKTNCYIINTSKGDFKADKLILATGSKAAPATGSDGSGLKIAKELGLSINKMLPALCALYSDNKAFFKATSGVRVKAKLSLYADDKIFAADKGELQLTDYGISGIPAFQVSRYASRALDNNKKVYALIDFTSDIADTYSFIKNRIKELFGITTAELGIGFINKKLWMALLKIANIKSDIKADTLTDLEIKKLASILKEFKINIISTAGFDKSQVCTGGVLTSELDYKTMSTKNDPDLNLAGEIIDVDGKCGGYNLQWAWTSGYIAGLASVR